MNEIKVLGDEVREAACGIPRFHGHGHLEKVYENALSHRLRNAGHDVRQQHPLQVVDEDDTMVGNYFADLVVDGTLIIELKTARALAPEHEAQILGHLKLGRFEHGVLINFDSYKFQMRKCARTESLQAESKTG